MMNSTRPGGVPETAMIVPPGSGEPFWLLNHATLCRLDGSATANAFSLFEPSVQPGAGAVLHLHHHADEALYVVEGRFALEVGERTLIAGPGDFLFVPRGVLHAFHNIGVTPGRLMTLSAPGGVESLFREVTPLLSAGDPPDYAALLAAARKHGIEIPRLREMLPDLPLDAAARGGRQVTRRPVHLPAGAGRTFLLGGGHATTCKASAADTGGTFSFFEAAARPGSGTPPHIHRNEDETFYILSGCFGILLGEKSFEAAPGTCVFAPRNLVHAWWNAGSETGTMLVVVTPGGLERFFAEIEQSIATADAPEDAIKKGSGISARYRIEMIAPVK